MGSWVGGWGWGFMGSWVCGIGGVGGVGGIAGLVRWWVGELVAWCLGWLVGLVGLVGW
jgi:hypothetical protein